MSNPTFETILLDIEDGIATITLNRPDRLNAFTAQMMLDMMAAFDATDADDAVKAVIVTGAGRGFCASSVALEAEATSRRIGELGEARTSSTRSAVCMSPICTIDRSPIKWSHCWAKS